MAYKLMAKFGRKWEIIISHLEWDELPDEEQVVQDLVKYFKKGGPDLNISDEYALCETYLEKGLFGIKEKGEMVRKLGNDFRKKVYSLYYSEYTRRLKQKLHELMFDQRVLIIKCSDLRIQAANAIDPTLRQALISQIDLVVDQIRDINRKVDKYLSELERYYKYDPDFPRPLDKNITPKDWYVMTLSKDLPEIPHP